MKVAWIGLGTMGIRMASRLQAAGHSLVVYNRTKHKADELVARGARWAESPGEAARGCDIVITMVSDTSDVAAVVFGIDGAAHGMAASSLLIDMSTIDPHATQTFAAQLKASCGAAWLDAPVSGGSEGAERGTLSIMVGGAQADLERAMPLLAQMGKTITRVGDIGAGQMTKAMNQVIIAGTYAAVAEGLVLGMKAGVDIDAAMQALAGGAAGSWGLINRGPNIINNRYPLGFRVRLHRKDLGIALSAGRALGVSLPVAATVEQWETSLIGRGYGDEDVSAIARIARELAGLDEPQDPQA